MTPTLSTSQQLSCPECGAKTLYRSRRRGLGELILHRVFFLSPYRCQECDYRHMRFRPLRAPQVLAQTSRPDPLMGKAIPRSIQNLLSKHVA